MGSKGLSRADQNKGIRQEALRDQLSSQKHVQHVIDIAEQLADLKGEGNQLDATQVARLKAAADIKLKLIGKYLPDLKQIESKVVLETTVTDIDKIRSDLAKLERGETIDSTSTEIKDE